jgi:rod shape determining protein RodA
MILMLAVILGELRDRAPHPGLPELALALACGGLPLLLVVLQPDLGVTIVLLVLLMGVIALSGIRLRWLAGLSVAAVLAGLAAWSLHLLKPYQVQRLTAFANPSADPRGTGYSAAQSKIAIGSGGLYGHGLFHGPLTAGNFVPEQHTDFIFSVAGEELGFAGAAVIIALLAVVFLRALRISAQADDQFGMLVAAGIAIWFAVQSFVNIGMTIGIMPVTGLPLPFGSIRIRSTGPLSPSGLVEKRSDPPRLFVVLPLVSAVMLATFLLDATVFASANCTCPTYCWSPSTTVEASSRTPASDTPLTVR